MWFVPRSGDVEAAVRILVPSTVHMLITREYITDDAYLYNVTYQSAGTQSILRARNYGARPGY